MQHGYKAAFRLHFLLGMTMTTVRVLTLLLFVVSLPTQLVLAESSQNTSRILQEKVQSRLQADPDLGKYSIIVDLHGDVASISGEVENPDDQAKIADIVKNTTKVRAVINNLNVIHYSDHLIFKEIEALLDKQKDLSKPIYVKVDSGNVLLSGDVNNFRVVDRILSVVLNVPGVNQIKSNITVNGKKY